MAEQQKVAYKHKLLAESSRIELERLDDELKIIQKIKVLDNEVASLNEHLDQFRRDNEHDNDHDYEHLKSQLERQRDTLESKCLQNETLKQQIEDLGGNVGTDISQEQISRLTAKCQQFEVQNADLRQQIKAISVDSQTIDESLAKQFDIYSRDMDLKKLREVFEFLLERKATEPDIDFDVYMTELRKDQANFSSILTDLNINNKKAEIELKKIKKIDTSGVHEEWLELAFKVRRMLEVVEEQKARNYTIQSRIDECKSDISERENEINTFREYYEDVKRQCDTYHDASLDQSSRLQEEEHRRMISQYLGMSSASSLAGSGRIPSPPPLDLSMEEILRSIK